MITINMATKKFHDLSLRRVNTYLELIKMIDNATAAHYKSFQYHLALTKSRSDEKIILITNLQAKTTPNFANFTKWMHCFITKMDLKLYSDSVTLISYVLQLIYINVSFKDVYAATSFSD